MAKTFKYRVYDGVDTDCVTFRDMFAVYSVYTGSDGLVRPSSKLWMTSSIKELVVRATAMGISDEIEPEIWAWKYDCDSSLPREKNWLPSGRTIDFGGSGSMA